MSGELKKPEPEKERPIPDIIINPQTRRRYLKGKFLGKGGFARCFELTDMETNEIFAGKIVSKTLLVKKHQKDKMAQEISIHRNLSHKHVVKFISYFEDSDNVYILLELCRRRSLMELHKRRRAITEPETRYYLQQILLACKYLHENRVIHRDLKLGNLFINDEMEVKIGDFGLATVLDYDGERKKTLCGTPNYIAPEMLSKKGHSYEVDTWAIGCIMFTLLAGKPPFETQTLKETYTRIRKNEYHVPSKLSTAARHLIQKLLQPDPINRPSVDDIFSFEFLTQGYMPNGLPVSSLTLPPNFPKDSPTNSGRRLPLSDTTNKAEFVSPQIQARKDQLTIPVRSLKSVPENQILSSVDTRQMESNNLSEKPSGSPDFHLHRLFRQLTQLVHSRPSDRLKPTQEDEAEDPAAMPVFWISKWVDYSDKFGLGYQLCDNGVGVLFNDFSKILLNGTGLALQYIDRDGNEEFHSMVQYPPGLCKKITLLNYFRTYMNEHLLKAGENVAPKEGDELTRLPYLRQWFRTRSAIVLHLSNGTLQINFFKDHVKLILCPLMGAITYINEQREFKTFRFTLLEEFGCSSYLTERLTYARNMVERLMLKTSSSSSRPVTMQSVGLSEERK